MLEAAKTGPVTLEVASCARPAPLLNHRPLLRKNPPARVGGIEPPAEVGSGKQSHLGTKRGSDVARICAGPASGCNARALPLPWCRRPSSLPYSYLQRLAELLVARRYCCHPPVFRRTADRLPRAPLGRTRAVSDTFRPMAGATLLLPAAGEIG